MLQDSLVMSAITDIPHRSEREPDQERLVRSFVDSGIKPLLTNQNNQIVYGRRGTGKTHLLKVLEAEVTQRANTISVYIDTRTLGSTNQFSDVALPVNQRCLSLFRDIFKEIYDALLRYIVEVAPSGSDEALSLLDELMSVITNPASDVRATTLETKATSETAGGSSANISVGLGKVGASAGGRREGKSSSEETMSYAITVDDNIIFPDLQSALRRLLKTMSARLVILLDEWSSIPLDLQPYLAEFIKRSVIPNASITIKIASLEHRSQFSVRDESRRTIVGLEVGADISAGLDIDDYYVYDRNPEQITRTFADVLYRHLASNIAAHLNDKYAIASGQELVRKMFVSESAFEELARAAEGVVRDLIHIFTTAALNAHRRSRPTIDRRAVLEAARQWYEQDKVKELSDPLRKVLESIILDVIGKRRARAFLMPRHLEKHPMVQGLFDARVLHLLLRGYADKDNPGRRYNIYSIDYGTYVDLLNTSTAPDMDFVDRDVSGDEEFVVPFNDHRSIRRIVLTEAILGEIPKSAREILAAPKKSFRGLSTGDRGYHPSYGIIMIEDISSQLIKIVTEAGEVKTLATSVAFDKIRRLDEEVEPGHE